MTSRWSRPGSARGVSLPRSVLARRSGAVSVAVERATITSMLERRSSIAATVPISGALGPAGQQPADGRGDRCEQRLEVVAALERESDAGDAEPRRDTGYGPGSGLVAELGDGQLGERVRGMRVISRGDEDRGGPVGLDGGQQVLDPGGHERVVTVAGEERPVERR